MGEGGLDATAVVVPADDDVLYVEMHDGVFDHGHDVEVGIGDKIGDVAMHEDVAGFKTHDFVGGNAGVAAPDVSSLLLVM